MILLAGLIALTVIAAFVARHQLLAFTHARRRFESRLSALENRQNQEVLDAIEADNRRALLRESVNTGTSAVEIAHRAISTTTFEVIDRFSGSERFRLNSQQAREIHDDASRGIYRSIRVANKHLHALANVIIRENRQRDSQRKKTTRNPRNRPDE
jgi:hypothetical protein